MIALHLLTIAWSVMVLYYFRSPSDDRYIGVIVTNVVLIGLNVVGILYRLLVLHQ